MGSNHLEDRRSYLGQSANNTINSTESLDNTYSSANQATNATVVGHEHDSRLEISQTTSFLKDLSDSRLSIIFNYYGSYLSEPMMITTIVIAFAIAAIPSSDTVIHENLPPFKDVSSYSLYIEPFSRPRAPYLTFGWLIDAIADLGEYLIDHNIWHEITMWLKVDSRIVGKVYVSESGRQPLSDS